MRNLFSISTNCSQIDGLWYVSLTNTSLTEIVHGEKAKREITEDQYKELLYTLFAIEL